MKTNYFSFSTMKKLSLVALFFVSTLAANAQATQSLNIRVGDKARRIAYYAPKDLPKNSPLLISMHGAGQDANYQKAETNFHLVADTAKFVVVFPQGENNLWDISGTKDTDFILAIIDKMHDNHAIDKGRVYISGFSMGGMMTYYTATKLADKIAAFAPVGGYLMGGVNTKSSRPIPLIHIHGTADDVCSYAPVQSHIDAWVTRNKCSSRATTIKPYPKNKPNSNATYKVWKGGEDGVEVVLISLEGVGHWHSKNAEGAHSSIEIWNFCKQFSLPTGSSINTDEVAANATVVSEEYYNLLGQKEDAVESGAKGVYVVKSNLSDGTAIVRKTYID